MADGEGDRDTGYDKTPADPDSQGSQPDTNGHNQDSDRSGFVESQRIYSRRVSGPDNTTPGDQNNEEHLDDEEAEEREGQESPLDFSVRNRTNSSIPRQNLNNKLNGLNRHGDQRSKYGSGIRSNQHGAEEEPVRGGYHSGDRNDHYPSTAATALNGRYSKHLTIKTEAISPVQPDINGLSPVSEGPGDGPEPYGGEAPDGARFGEPRVAISGARSHPHSTTRGSPTEPAQGSRSLHPKLLQSGLHVPQESIKHTSPDSSARSSVSGNTVSSGPGYPSSIPSGFPPLASMTGLDLIAAQAMAANSEEVFSQYKQYVMALQEQLRSQRSPGGSSTSESSSQGHKQSPHVFPGMHSPSGSGQEGTPLPPTSGSSPFSIPTSPQSQGSVPYVPRTTPSRKRGKSLPESQKDEAYWDRRRKNNEAAKRSRDSRRAKEDQIAIRAAFLEQENLKLRVEVTALKNETAKLRCMLYNS